MSEGILNRRTALRASFVSLTAGLLFAQGRTWSADKDKDKDTKIELDKVPKGVKAAADKAVPKAKWTDATMTKEDGDTYYLLEGTDAKRRYVWIELDDEGGIEEIQTEIPTKDVPAVVMKALKAKLPKFMIKTVYEVRDEGDKVTQYDFEGKRPKDEDDIMVVVSTDGKKIEVDV